MTDRPLLPARFGTLLGSVAEVRATLGSFAGRLASALRQLGDAVQIEVAATWDLKRAFAEVGSQPEIAALVAAGRTHGESLAIRVQVGKLVKEALDRRREEYREQAVRALAPIARDVQPNPLLMDELVINVAFLIERTRVDEFYAQVHRLDEAFEGRLSFRCIGPLAPYSFATVEILRPRADQVEAARALLELGERVSQSEIDSSYRRLAQRHHPDLHPSDPTAAARFGAITAAHALLRGYVRGRLAGAETQTGEAASDVADPQVDLSRSALEGAVLLAISRTDSDGILTDSVLGNGVPVNGVPVNGVLVKEPAL